MIKLKNKNLIISVALLSCLVLPMAGHAGPSGKVTRAEKIIMNLPIGNGSAGYHIFEAKREAKQMHKNLRRALYKVRQADKVYAKSVGKPDTKYLEAATVKLKTLKEKTKELEREIEDTYYELKSSIKHALLTGSAMQK